MVPVANILHQETIRRLSGDRAFERGRSYFQEGKVSELTRKDGSVHAKVVGSEPYAVRIWIKDESLAYSCSCPQGQDQAFCKHAVAVALAATAPFEAGIPEPIRPKTIEAAPRFPAPDLEATFNPAAELKQSTKPEPKAPPKGDSKSLAAALRAMPHEQLVLFVLETALDDDAFRERLTKHLRT